MSARFLIAGLLALSVSATGCDVELNAAGDADADATVVEDASPDGARLYLISAPGPAAPSSVAAPVAPREVPTEARIRAAQEATSAVHAEVTRALAIGEALELAELASLEAAIAAADIAVDASTPAGVVIEAAPVLPDPGPDARWVGMVVGDAVVLSDTVEEAWLSTSARSLAHGEDGWFESERGVDFDALPTALKAWHGQRVHLYDAKGVMCEASVQQLAARSYFVDHGNEWEMDDPEIPEAERHNPRSRTPEAAWADGARLLVGILSTTCGGGPVYARHASQPEALVLAPVTTRVPRLTRRLALRALRKLPEYAAIQATYREAIKSGGYTGAPRRWDAWEGAEPTVRRFASADGEREVVLVRANAGYGCGEPGGHLTALFEVGPRGRMTNLGAVDWDEDIQGVMDLDGDGAYELIGPDQGTGSRILQTLGYETVEDLDIPDHSIYGCPC